MFKNLFKKSNKITKTIYLVGWEAHFNGDRACEDFIATQITDKNTFETVSAGIELVFENDKLTKAFDSQDGEKSVRELKSDEIGLIYQNFQANKISIIVENPNGLHQMGGELSHDFKFPENKCIVPFQYLGYINNADPNFSWLPFKLHLTCPIYLNIENVFLDYSDSLNPKIINKEEVENADTSYEEDLNPNSEIVFNEMKFDFIDEIDFSEPGHAGIPNWIQYPDIPTCPISGRRMKFVCQLNSGVTTKRSNVEAHDEWFKRYYEELNFWGDGDLFVFFEPSSKVACYFIQNT